MIVAIIVAAFSSPAARSDLSPTGDVSSAALRDECSSIYEKAIYAAGSTAPLYVLVSIDDLNSGNIFDVAPPSGDLLYAIADEYGIESTVWTGVRGVDYKFAMAAPSSLFVDLFTDY